MKWVTVLIVAIVSIHTLDYGIAAFKQRVFEYSDTSSFANHKENTCVSTGNHFDIELKVKYERMETNVGEWRPVSYTMVLDPVGGMDLDTVAHEVSHFVDTVMHDYALLDDHYEAYLQGSWTKCVWELVEKDLLFNFKSDDHVNQG
jgi:hypothetical protein